MSADEDANAARMKRPVPYTEDPDAIEAMRGLEAYIAKTGLEHSLLELVKVRASQINGCAYCLHLHIAKALEAGEDATRLHLLPAWRESRLYTPRERAALAWCEALTLVAGGEVSDTLYKSTEEHFPGKEMVQLTMVVGTINAWNRLMLAFDMRHPKDKPAG